MQTNFCGKAYWSPTYTRESIKHYPAYLPIKTGDYIYPHDYKRTPEIILFMPNEDNVLKAFVIDEKTRELHLSARIEVKETKDARLDTGRF